MTDYKNNIEANPKIMFGKPCIKGTRIPVELILNRFKGGYSFEDLLDAYPRITKEDIEACLYFEEKEKMDALFLHDKTIISSKL